jgi:hypothetical protein
MAVLALVPARADAALPASGPAPSSSSGTVSPHSTATVAPAVPSGAVNITFDEFPVGTVITTQYANDYGIVFQGDTSGDDQFISTDSANPNSPELSGTPRFAGDVGAHFVFPGTATPATVNSVTMDVGYIDNPGSTEVNAYDAAGTLLGSVVANQIGFNRLRIAFRGIASFTVTSASDEPAGFGVDNVTFFPSQKIRVSSVHLNVSSSGTGSSALPADVIDDRVHQPALTIADFQACGTASAAQWVDCSPTFPDGTPEKAWPVVFQRGSAVTLNEARLRIRDSKANLDGSTVTGTAAVGGATLTFTAGPVDPSGGEFVIKNVTSDNPLPDTVSSLKMTIEWKVQHGPFSFRAGSSTIPIYLTYAAPGFPAYLSLEDLTATAAAGQATEATVFNSIWTTVFSAAGPAALAIHPRDLDPVTGSVTPDSHTLQYWTPWNLANDYLFLDSARSCDHLTTPKMLRDLVSRCGDWAQLLADTMSVQGITTVAPHGVSDPGVPGTFPAFPAPAPPAGSTIDAEVMLIKNWAFPGAPTGTDPNFGYLTTDTVKLDPSTGDPVPGTGVLGAHPQFNDAPGVSGQNDANPPGWFAYTDHAIDVYNNMIYDPSYGLGPFASIGDWANSALDGFAYITHTDGTDPSGNPIRTYTLSGHKGLP